MAELHHWVFLAQRLAEGRRQHPSNAAFGQWLKKDPELRRLTHRDRAALLKIATLDPQEAAAAIRRSNYTTPEHLWYRALITLAGRKTAAAPVRKTEPEPEPEAEDEVDYAEKVEDFLERLRLADKEKVDPACWYEFFDEYVLQLAATLNYTSSDSVWVFGQWLEHQRLYDLNDDDRDFLIELTFPSRYDTWAEIVKRVRKSPRRSSR
jgi:hypothetical protein